MTAPTPALTVEHLTVRFGSREVLNDLSFAVPEGSTLAVIGPNGSGKTVLFRALVGAIPYAGTIRWAPNARLGYVPQKLDLERDLPITGGDLLRARARLAHASRSDVEQALESVGISSDVTGSLIGTLSGGQFQRLLIAFAMLGRPTVLLLDEATAGVDEPGQEQLYETVHRLRTEHGVTVLMISHEVNIVSQHATNVLCLSPEHTCFGNPRQVLTPTLLSQVYGTPVSFYTHDHTAS
jgi:zinc transport system ATP-binding protein